MAVSLDPEFADALEEVFAIAGEEGIAIEITSGFRSGKRQQQLYRAWLKGGRHGLPVARPGKSLHEYGLAIDIRTDPARALSRVGEIAEAMGLRWGGRFKDPVHIDAGIPVQEARRIFRKTQLVEVE